MDRPRHEKTTISIFINLLTFAVNPFGAVQMTAHRLYLIPITVCLGQQRLYRLWLVGCFGFNGPLRQYFSLYWAVSQKEGDRGEKG